MKATITFLILFSIQLLAGIGIGYSDFGALPVELTSFTAKQSVSSVVLRWATATEVSNYGFEIQKSVVNNSEKLNNNDSNWIKIGFVSDAHNSNSPKQYSFVDEHPVNGKIHYRLKQIDSDGNYKYSQEVEIINIPLLYSLSQNYPNPFNPTTVIRYAIPFESNINIMFYNFLGQTVREVNEATMQPGYYELNFNSSGLASGVYFYTIKAVSTDGKNNFSAVKKMIIIK